MNEERCSITTVSNVNEVLHETIESATDPISYIYYQEQTSQQERRTLSALAEAIQPGSPEVGVSQIQNAPLERLARR